MKTMSRIVDDDNIAEIGNVLQKMGETLNDAICKYCSILSSVTSSAIKSGKTTDAINALKDQAEALKNHFSLLGECSERGASNFVSDIDKADRYLY